MNILFVSGHPAQVHNFRLVREELIKRGHTVYWLTTPKDICIQLLDIYGIPYEVLYKPNKHFLSKVWALIRNVCWELVFLKKKKIDIAVTRTCPYTSVAMYLLHRTHIIHDDTEHAARRTTRFSNLASAVVVPNCFKYEIRTDAVRYDGNTELFYTHKNWFTPQPPYDILQISPETRYAVVRFVKWNAYHDKGLEEGFCLENKIRMVEELSKYVRVFVSAEANEVPKEIESYLIQIPLERMHDVLAYAELIIGESATMASESVDLGTPAVYVDEIGRGYTDEEAEEGLLYMFRPNQQEEAIKKAVEVVSPSFDRALFTEKQKEFISKKIDPTAFLTWFIENYPESKKIMETNPEYQYHFR